MPTPATNDEFLDLVRKSGVTDEKRLDAHVQKLRAAGTLPVEPAKLAGALVRDGLLTNFQVEQLLQGKWKRFFLGKYKVLEELGIGGMGRVYLCEHKWMKRRVAVKVLPTAKAAQPSSLERFFREARVAADLIHPNIVHTYDIDRDETLHFLVMEYVDGASLQEVVRKSGPLDPIRAAHYIRQAALGLQHAHESGLVHRDIKPGNILVDRAGGVKILDMGLARILGDEEDNITRKYDENSLGTADYLAPEQVQDSHTVDIRADIYSLGATFYFLLTGRTLFGAGTTAEKLLWHQTRQPKPVRSIRPGVPDGMAEIVTKMMAKDADARYQTPNEVAEALAPWIQGEIAPPSESEMPQLSPLATGQGPMTETANGVPRTPAPRKNWQVASAPPPRPAAPRPDAETLSDPAGSRTTSAPPMPVPAAVKAPAATTDARPKEKPLGDTDAHRARMDTPSQLRGKGRSKSSTGSAKKSAAPKAERRRYKKFAILMGIVLLAALLGIGLALGLFGRVSGGRADVGDSSPFPTVSV